MIKHLGIFFSQFSNFEFKQKDLDMINPENCSKVSEIKYYIDAANKFLCK